VTVLTSRRHRLPKGVTVDDLDLRWLIPRHRDQLAAGKLRVPDQANHFRDGHPATLVSVPDGFGCPVAWIDVEIAELIWRLNRVGVDTLECCQGGGYDVWGGRGSAYIAFPGPTQCNRFLALAEDALRGEEVERSYGRSRVVRFPHSQVRRITRTVRNA
jgi:hypothetical protein